MTTADKILFIIGFIGFFIFSMRLMYHKGVINGLKIAKQIIQEERKKYD